MTHSERDLASGTPTYNQHTVAFPSLPVDRDDAVFEGVSVSLDAPGGGTFGSFHFNWHRLGNAGQGVRLEAFGDAMQALTSPRIWPAVVEWAGLPDPDDISPAEMLALLERHDIVPDRYHLNPVGPKPRSERDKAVDSLVATGAYREVVIDGVRHAIHIATERQARGA